MIIGVIVEAVIPSGTTGGSSPHKNSSQDDVEDWISCIILVIYLPI